MKDMATMAKTIDSRDVAEMVEKSHGHLMRDIEGYVKVLQNSTETNFGLSDFFTESTYKDSTGRTLPCYEVTKKGCEFIANKLTGEKGIRFTAAYVTKFNEMEYKQSGKTSAPPDQIKADRAAAMLRNSKARVAGLWLKIAERTDIAELAKHLLRQGRRGA
jgi:Rha family phage regulatory protein